MIEYYLSDPLYKLSNVSKILPYKGGSLGSQKKSHFSNLTFAFTKQKLPHIPTNLLQLRNN